MSKRKRTSVQGMMKPAPSHSQVVAQVHGQVTEQLHDEDVPVVSAEPEPETNAPRSVAPAKRTRVKPALEPELKDYSHRSLYARAETLDLIRDIAFKERISAQALYREGLFLMLRERGHFKGKTIDDV